AQRNDEQHGQARAQPAMTLVAGQSAVRLVETDLGGDADAVAPVPRPRADHGHAAVVGIAVHIQPRPTGQGCARHPRRGRLAVWPDGTRESALDELSTGAVESVALPGFAEPSPVEDAAQVEMWIDAEEEHAGHPVPVIAHRGRHDEIAS